MLLPYILLTVILFWASITFYRKGKLLLAFIFISPLLAYIAYEFTINAKKADDLQYVTEFVKSNKYIMQITRKVTTIHRPEGSTMHSEGPLPFKYEVPVSIADNSELSEIYVIVNASRTWIFGRPTFSITCITTKQFTERDTNKSICEQEGVIQIPAKIQSSL